AKALMSALRWAAHQVPDWAEELPEDFIEQVKAHPDQIKALAQGARTCLLSWGDQKVPYLAAKPQKDIPEQRKAADHKHNHSRRGRIRDCDLERYCARVAAVYKALIGKTINYAKATSTSRKRPPGEVYGDGLDFMQLAMRLIDGSTTPHQAQREIDRIQR